MTNTETPSTAAGTTEGGRRAEMTTRSEGSLVTERGKTTIADTVVAKIAGISAREVSGVHDLGGSGARAVGTMRERIPGARTNQAQGIAVEVGERQAAVDIDLVAEYGVTIGDLAGGVRRNVITAVERMTGLEVTEVNITVHDVFVDDGSEDEPVQSTQTRVE
jgi:uncharacterized alkaline shock family protein YloU